MEGGVVAVGGVGGVDGGVAEALVLGGGCSFGDGGGGVGRGECGEVCGVCF